MASVTRKIAPGSLRASVAGGSYDEKTRTVDLQWTTGERVLRYGWDGPFFEELSLDPSAVRMGRLQSGRAPLLADHNSYSINSVLGVVESASLGSAKVRFAEGDPEVDAVVNKVRQGILPNVSVGYRIYKAEQIGTAAQAEGGRQIPVYRVTDWEPNEISLVAVGADSQAAVRGASAEPNDIEVSTPDAVPEKQAMTPEEIAAQKAADEKRAAELKAAGDAAVAADRVRVEAIRTLNKTANLGDEFAREMELSGKPIDEVRKLAFERMANKADSEGPKDGAFGARRVEVGEEDREKFVRGAVAGLFARGDSSDLRKAIAGAKKGEEKCQEFAKMEIGGEFRGMSMEQLARRCLDRQRVRHAHINSRNELFKLALRAPSYASSSDFVVVTEELMHKTLRASYATQVDTWRRWMGTDSVPDLRNSNRYMAGAMSGRVPAVGENEEYTMATLPDGSKVQISTQKHGKMIGISLEALINDDIGAIQATISTFGRYLGREQELQAYELLALNGGLGPYFNGGSDPFFDDAAFANVSTTAALSVAAIDADRIKMRMQRDLSGQDYLDINPDILLVSVGLESTAGLINTSPIDPTAGTANNLPNVAVGIFRDVAASPRLTGTRRYLFAGKEAFKMVTLEGFSEGPTLERQEGFEVDGTRWKATMWFKPNAYDPKLALTNAG